MGSGINKWIFNEFCVNQIKWYPLNYDFIAYYGPEQVEPIMDPSRLSRLWAWAGWINFYRILRVVQSGTKLLIIIVSSIILVKHLFDWMYSLLITINFADTKVFKVIKILKRLFWVNWSQLNWKFVCDE